LSGSATKKADVALAPDLLVHVVAPAAFAPGLGRHRELLLEGLGEGRVGREAAILGDAHDGHVRLVAQQVGGAAQAPLALVFDGREAGQLAEDAVEVEGRIAGRRRQAFQRERIADRVQHQVHHFVQARHARGRLHALLIAE
jgi:hypothetical protein